MTTLRNDLELRMTNLEKRMTELETNMKYITALTSFDAPPETHPHHLRRASTNIDNHFPPAEIDATGLSARVAAIELLLAAGGRAHKDATDLNYIVVHGSPAGPVQLQQTPLQANTARISTGSAGALCKLVSWRSLTAPVAVRAWSIKSCALFAAAFV